MKRKLVIRLTACCIVGAMLMSGNVVAAESMALLLPVAGSARVLGEGTPVATVASTKTRSVDVSDYDAVEAVEESASEVPVEEAIDDRSGDTAEDSGDEKEEATTSTKDTEESKETESKETESKETESSEESEGRKSDSKATEELPSAGAGSNTSNNSAEKADSEESGDNSSDTSNSKQNKKKKTTVSADNAESITAGAGTAVETSDSDDADMNLVDAVTTNPNEEDEDLSNLVIAKVNDYVYVRSEPSEDSEYVGKLYNHSVGSQLETEGDWIKIKSGTTEGYVKKSYVVTGSDAETLAKEVGTRTARVLTTTLYVRADASTDADVIGMVPMDDQLTVTEETEGWAKVSVEEGEGYVSTEFVKLYTDFVHAESKAEEEARLEREEREREAARKAAEAAEAAERKAREKEEAKKAKNSQKGSQKGSQKSSAGSSKSSSGGGGGYSASGSGSGAAVANYALQFVGNPYVYGGTSLTNGADCSGFVMSVYRKFGISLPHSSGGDRGVGTAVSGGLANAQAGDIVCYSGHVAIYIGGGQIVHASTAKTGIKVSNASYRTPVAVRRIF